MMGSGKSTVAKEIAKLSGLTWKDTDQMIEDQEHKSIHDIFDELGESGFRDIETDVCEELLELKNCVISTGGGIVLRHDNQDVLRECAIVVYLVSDIDTILDRIKGNTSRPLLQVENPRAELNRIYKERHLIYESLADFRINTNDQTPAELAARIWDTYTNQYD